MNRITSQSGAVRANLEPLEARRLLSGTLEVVEMLESDLPPMEMPPLIEEQSPKYEPITDDEMIARGYEKAIVGRDEVWAPRGKAIFRIKLDLPPLMRESADGHQYGDMTRPWEGSEAATQEIIARIEALAPAVTVTGGELYGANGQFFVELGDMTFEAFTNATADLGGVTTHVTTLRLTVMPSYAWGQRFGIFSTPMPVEQPPISESAAASQNAEMTRWIVNFERPTFVLFPGGNRAVDLDAIYNPEVIIDRDAQIAELGSEIRFVHNMVHQYSILVEAPAHMTAEQMTAILSRLDGFKSVAQDQVIASVRPPGELFSQQPSAGTSPAAGFWNDTPGNALVDLDDDTDDAILMLTHPAGELLG